MSKGPKITNFVSEMDKFLEEFNKEHPVLTKSQQKEVNKYQPIYRLRDISQGNTDQEKKLWEDF